MKSLSRSLPRLQLQLLLLPILLARLALPSIARFLAALFQCAAVAALRRSMLGRFLRNVAPPAEIPAHLQSLFVPPALKWCCRLANRAVL